MTNFEELGKAFVAHYYQTLASSRGNLQTLYADDSMMTFEGQPCQGKEDICNKLQGLAFKTIQHKITSLDCQPVVGAGRETILVVVMGQLQTDNDPPHSFTQSFLLRNSGAAFYIANEMFRMVLHD